MDADDQQINDAFNASLPLPSEGDLAEIESSAVERNPAADLIRHKITTLYEKEPETDQTIVDAIETDDKSKDSRHQKFIHELIHSGKSVPDIQVSWHEYYAALPDHEKHQVWQEFYDMHAQASQPKVTISAAPHIEPKEVTTPSKRPIKENLGSIKNLTELRESALRSLAARTSTSPKQHLQSLMFGIGVGSIVVLIFLFSFFNERFIAPFIQPSRISSNTPIISSNGPISKNPEIIIPKINAELHVVYNVNSIDEAAVQKALEEGVIHYADTALPGQNGNVVIVGHSAGNIFNKGKYKYAFTLLNRVDKGDTFILQKDGKRYIYQVYKKEVVNPADVNVLGVQDKLATATLITCDPPGLSVNRLVVIGEQISPDPVRNIAQQTDNKLATQSAIIPGNSPSLWHRLTHWFSD